MRQRGFTLIELLVVIAIIAILAAIVVPRIADYLSRARMTKAVSEIRGVDTAVTKMLADADKNSVYHMFLEPQRLLRSTVAATLEYQTKVMYKLLRRGREAGLDDSEGLGLRPDVRKKLGYEYMPLENDPWGNRYNFFFGSYRDYRDRVRDAGDIDPPTRQAPMVFRSYRPISAGCMEADDDEETPYVYDPCEKGKADDLIPGNPAPDDLAGYPAPLDLPVYVFSSGEDLEPDQLVDFDVLDAAFTAEDTHDTVVGKDDVNNWDKTSGWAAYY